MEERKFDKEWKCFYEDLKTDSRPSMMYNYYFVLRRFFFTLSLFYMYDYVALQIIVFVLTSEFYVLYFVYCRPFVDNSINNQEILNEVTTIFVSYHIVCFTDFVETATGKFLMGYSCIVVIGLNIANGITRLIAGMIFEFRQNTRRKSMLKKDRLIRLTMNKKYSPYA